MPSGERTDAIVVGGGIVGLAIAWAARRRGMSVTLLERERTGAGTSRVAAGMLAPVAEVEFGEAGRRVLELGLRSAAMWPSFAADLERRSGLAVGLLRTGSLLVARDDDEARELERQLAFRESLGLAVTRLRPSEARAREGALAPTVRLALEVADDHAVDPRPVLAALRRACELDGVEIVEGVSVQRVVAEPPGAGHTTGHETSHVTGNATATATGAGMGVGAEVRVCGVASSDGRRWTGATTVLAAGPWTESIDGLPEGAGVPVRPVKGQILRLRDPAGPGLLQRVLRFEGGYLVPRGDGRYVLGATVEEKGYELAPTAGGVYELLRDAHELVPGLSELEIEELSVGLRPGTPDNVPVVGPAAVDGLVWATGHYRNGILLAPLTGELVAGVLAGDAPDAALAACAPERFTRLEALAS